MRKGIAPILVILIILAVSGAGLLTSNLISRSNLPHPTVVPAGTAIQPTSIAPLPTEKDIIMTFFILINEKRVSEAVGMMVNEITNNDSQKQAWGVQFNAINSIKVLSIEPWMQKEWLANGQFYKLSLDVQMNPDSANATIPYYGWDNGKNTRWIVLQKEGNLWKISGLATGP
jgi:hypothetical protein